MVYSELLTLDSPSRSGELTLVCGVVDRPGWFVVELTWLGEETKKHNTTSFHTDISDVLGSNSQQSSVSKPHLMVGRSDPILAHWPPITITLPSSISALQELNHVSLHVTSFNEVAENNNSTLFTNEDNSAKITSKTTMNNNHKEFESYCDSNTSPLTDYAIEILYLGKDIKKQKLMKNKKKLVNRVAFSHFDKLIGVELMFNCSLFDRGGSFQVISMINVNHGTINFGSIQDNLKVISTMSESLHIVLNY